jgi:hypothetical protein
MAQISWESNGFPDILDAADIGYQPLKTKSIASVRD